MALLKISSTDWDYLIVGDGSGTTWQHAFGWGSTLIAKTDLSRQLFYGSMSCGTNNMAELLAALHPLMFLSNNTNWEDKPHGLKVHVVTDSQYVAQGLAKDNPIWVSTLDVNRELWMAIHMTRRRGLELKGHHIPRDTIDLNKLGHDLANLSRKTQIGLLKELKWDAYQSNPKADYEETRTTLCKAPESSVAASEVVTVSAAKKVKRSASAPRSEAEGQAR